MCIRDSPIGHHLDQGVSRRVVGEPHLIADGLADLDVQFVGDPLGHAAGGDPARLGVSDQAGDAAAQLLSLIHI